MATVCETPRAKATHGARHETKGCDFAISATDACVLIESGAWGTVMSVATGFDMSDATNNNAAHDAAHRAAIVARFGE